MNRFQQINNHLGAAIGTFNNFMVFEVMQLWRATSFLPFASSEGNPKGHSLDFMNNNIFHVNENLELHTK